MKSFAPCGRAFLLIGLIFAGCKSTPKTEPVLYRRNPELNRLSIAVAPAINLSGSADFDPTKFADFMANELGHADGISVIPVSRVLGVLAAQGLDRVESPAHAGELARWLGADAVLVFAVTQYDPYDPPSIGISAQLFGHRRRPSDAGGALDGAGQQDGSLERGQKVAGAQESAGELLAQTQLVFNASHDEIVKQIQRFAQGRDSDNSPYGWRKYVVSQQGFIQFCCYATIRGLLEDPSTPVLISSRTKS